jgi:hypothetical protein
MVVDLEERLKTKNGFSPRSSSEADMSVASVRPREGRSHLMTAAAVDRVPTPSAHAAREVAAQIRRKRLGQDTLGWGDPLPCRPSPQH